jgi:hypothetical protein
LYPVARAFGLVEEALFCQVLRLTKSDV